MCFILVSYFLSSCDYNRNSRSYTYFPDMKESRSYETYSQNNFFEDSVGMRQAAENTIARDYDFYEIEKTDSSRLVFAGMTKNPIENTQANLFLGESLYKSYCIYCHGEKGDGKGDLFLRGLYNYPPKSLISEKMKTVSDADIYHVISVGYGIMAAHNVQVNSHERWLISSYVKNVLQKK